jgi:hypothetical protein
VYEEFGMIDIGAPESKVKPFSNAFSLSKISIPLKVIPWNYLVQ